MLAHEPGLSCAVATQHFPGLPILARLSVTSPAADIAAIVGVADLSLELVVDDLPGLAGLALQCRLGGVRPASVVALPRKYLTSCQSVGPWPSGPKPDDFIQPLRDLFPNAAIGGGSLTNFTEFNRCHPDPDMVDFIIFGNTAIVHAADDRSVMETLQALPHIFASAKAIAPGKPLRLGLFSIGMRANPYGADVVENLTGQPVPMARNDARQATDFAAANAVGVLAAATMAGVQSLALAMPDGPLGGWSKAGITPLGRVILMASRMGGMVTVAHSGGGVSLTGSAGRMAANLSDQPIKIKDFGLIAPYSVALMEGLV